MSSNLPTPHDGSRNIDRWHGTQLHKPAPITHESTPPMETLWERLPQGVKENVVGNAGEIVTWWTNPPQFPIAVVALGSDAFVVGVRSKTETGKPSFKMRVRRIVRATQRSLPGSFGESYMRGPEMAWTDPGDDFGNQSESQGLSGPTVLSRDFCDFIGNFPAYGQRAVQAPLLKSLDNVLHDYSFRLWEGWPGESKLKAWTFVLSGDRLAVVVGSATWPGYNRATMSWSLIGHFADLAPPVRRSESTSASAGSSGGSSSNGKMSLEEAAAFLIRHGSTSKKPLGVEFLLSGSEQVVSVFYREAVKRLHPDSGGSTTMFQQLREAKSLLDAHFAD